MRADVSDDFSDTGIPVRHHGLDEHNVEGFLFPQKCLEAFASYGLKPIQISIRSGDQTFNYELSFSLFNGNGTFRISAEKLEVKSYANFTLRQPPTDMPQQAFGLLQRLQAGQVSEMAATAEKGYLVFAQEKKIPDLSPTSPRYLEAQKQLMLFTASAAENSYLGDLVEQELKKTAPVNPR